MPSWLFLSSLPMEGQQIDNTIPQRSYKIADILILIQVRFNQLKLPLNISLSDKNRVTIKVQNIKKN